MVKSDELKATFEGLMDFVLKHTFSLTSWIIGSLIEWL